MPDDARAAAIEQLQLLTGCAKGLTGTADALLSIDDEEEVHDKEPLHHARDDPIMVHIRNMITQSIRRVMELWSNDSTTSDVRASLLILSALVTYVISTSRH